MGLNKPTAWPSEVREGSSRDLWKNWLSPHCVWSRVEIIGKWMGCKVEFSDFLGVMKLKEKKQQQKSETFGWGMMEFFCCC